MSGPVYLTSLELSRLDARLSDRDRRILQLMSDLALMSGAQVRRVLFENEKVKRSSRQLARRTLLRLTREGLLDRLERRIGGARSGSDGFTYRLAPAGQRLVASWSKGALPRGRRASEPGERFAAHRLAVSEVYVQLVEAAVSGELDVLEFQGEPACWRTYVAPLQGAVTLKPDAFVRVGVGALELWWFLEIDRGTVSQATRARQADAYRSFWRAGSGGELMPRVLWVATNLNTLERAAGSIRPDAEPAGLFRVATSETAVAAIVGREAAS
jgi:hypothetical protein